MNIFNNPEIKKITALHLSITLVFSIWCGFFSIYALLISLSMGLILLIINILWNKKRYLQINNLCNSIDKVLFGDDQISFSSCNDGELSILQSEIQKMTLRLREQNSALEKDKSILKNSIADISHQLRTPLTSMNLIVSMIKKQGTSANEQMEYIRNLTQLLGRIQWLIDVLLKLSQLDAGVADMKKESVNCNDLIRSAFESLEISAEIKGVEVQNNTGKNACFKGDFLWCREAVANVLKNCIDHTPSNGYIIISANENPVFTEIIIEDSGKGIPENILNNIFQRFYTTADISKNGYGIGLCLSKQILSENNGTIQAKNGKNGGAVFIIRFYKSVI